MHRIIADTKQAWILGLNLALLLPIPLVSQDAQSNNSRRPSNDSEMIFWLRNMIGYHGFSPTEVELATGIQPVDLVKLKIRLNLSKSSTAPIPPNQVFILPYPGGRHPRIGFLEGAVEPQRETKVSVFLPWDHSSYVVADIPEAIWSNLGLTYLAHTHIPTIFDKQEKKLPKLEWDRSTKNKLFLERKLPNGITFSSTIKAQVDSVRMSMTLTNRTKQKLSDLRVQKCVMLKAAKGFSQQTNDNKRFIGPYVVCHNSFKNKWIVTAWKPNHRPWANAPCPCLHSDPKFPDCLPGESKSLQGWLSFFEGKNIDQEIRRIEKLNWWKNDDSNRQ